MNKCSSRPPPKFFTPNSSRRRSLHPLNAISFMDILLLIALLLVRREISYAEFLHKVCSIANVLKSLGMIPSLSLPMTWQAVATFLACARVGAMHSMFRRPSSLFSSPIGRQSITPFRLPPVISRKTSAHHGESTLRPDPDKVLTDIADCVHNYAIDSELAFETARLCLMDTIGCGLEGLRFPECTKLLGPVVEGTIVPNGVYLRSCVNH